MEELQNLSTEERNTALAESLSEKVRQAKTRLGREAVLSEIGDELLLSAFCTNTDPKVRKNAYRLIGALEEKRCLEALRTALVNEGTLYAIPSLILALGALGDAESVKAYEPPLSTGIETDKHVAEITEAKKKVLQRLEKSEIELITRLENPERFLCVAPRGMEQVLAEELTELGFTPAVVPGGAMVTTAEVAALHRAKCMVEALIPIARNLPQDAEQIANAARDRLTGSYRIELVGCTKDRVKLIRRIAMAIGGENNPSNYSRELRVVCDVDRCDLFIRLYNIVDRRYPWRQGSIPASMHPATAAALVRYAKRFERCDCPAVLDPFCGSGTLLFSRAELSPCRGLLGVDKSGAAISVARKNAEAGRIKATFVCKDATRFAGRDGFDLILCNLPFGNRVGTHLSNRDMYRAFVRNLPLLLRDDGIAVLYTMEYRLMDKCLNEEKRLKRCDLARTESGGLEPWIFIVDKVH